MKGADPQAFYRKYLNLLDANFLLIEHEDAMVAAVYKVTCADGKTFILKECDRKNDYLREVYFLKQFAGKLPVPRIVQIVEPEVGVHGAILMEYLPGALLKGEDLTDQLAYEIGACLAKIHLNRVEGYGDLIQTDQLSSDPRVHFTLKFHEGIEECRPHLPGHLIEQATEYYERHVDTLTRVDGPCIIHRDFRPGNLIVKEGKLQGVIDWSSARGGFAEEDFCSLEAGEWRINDANKKAFLSGYSSIRKIPNYAKVMPLLRLSKAIATIGFTVKRGTWNNKDGTIYRFYRHWFENFLKDAKH